MQKGKALAFQENIITQNQTDCSTNFPAPKPTGIYRKMQKLPSAGRGDKNVKVTCVSPKP